MCGVLTSGEHVCLWQLRQHDFSARLRRPGSEQVPGLGVAPHLARLVGVADHGHSSALQHHLVLEEVPDLDLDLDLGLARPLAKLVAVAAHCDSFQASTHLHNLGPEVVLGLYLSDLS